MVSLMVAVEALTSYLGDGMSDGRNDGGRVLVIGGGRVGCEPHPRPEDVLRSGENVLVVGTASQRDGLARVFK